jgi:hypothetical protein
MANDNSQEELLKNVLDQVIQNNQQLKPGTPLADLKEAIEASLSSLPPLEFQEFSKVLEGDTDYTENLIKRAPEMIGWNADRIVEWIEGLAKKLESSK